jgi:hypothetical protein
MGSQTFIPRDYDVFAGLDVDKRSISVTFTDHQGFLKSLRMPYSVEHLLNHVRKHFADRKVAFVYEAGPTGYGLYDGIVAQAYRRVPPLRSVPARREFPLHLGKFHHRDLAVLLDQHQGSRSCDVRWPVFASYSSAPGVTCRSALLGCG